MTSCSNSTTLKEGILRGVFKQKAARAWFGCCAEKAQVTVLLPGNCSLSEWSDKVDCMPHSWPKSFNIGKMQMGPVQANTFHLHRKFTRARHMWLSLKPDWHLLATHMYTEWPGIHSSAEIHDRLFANPGRNDNIQDIKSKATWHSPAHWHWLGQCDYMWRFVDAGVALSLSLWKRPLRHTEPTCRWKKQKLQNILQLGWRRNGRPEMGSINLKIQNLLRKTCQKRMMQPMQNCFGKFERLAWKGLHHWGEHMRVALSGTSSRCFTVSPALISIFGGGFGWLWLRFLFGLCLFFFVWLFCLVCFPHEWDLLISFELCANSMQSWTTVRAVMARTAWEKKKKEKSYFLSTGGCRGRVFCLVCWLWLTCFARCAFTNLGIRILCLDRFVVTLANIHRWLVTFFCLLPTFTSVNFLIDLRRTGSKVADCYRYLLPQVVSLGSVILFRESWQTICIRLVSDTSMMVSAYELGSVYVSLPLRRFNCKRRRSPQIWYCHSQLLQLEGGVATKNNQWTTTHLRLISVLVIVR